MNARAGAGAIAAGRLVLGVAVLAAPEAVTGRWLGGHAKHPAVRYLAASLGARDAALGALALRTLRDPVLGPRVLGACAAVDAVDAIATVAARSELPPRGAIGTIAVAGSAAAAGLYLAYRLANP